jgi:hypothetical protein
LWHEAHDDDDGCENAQLDPGLRWQDSHAPPECPPGALWHEEQPEVQMCRNTAFLNGTPALWHEEQLLP